MKSTLCVVIKAQWVFPPKGKSTVDENTSTACRSIWWNYLLRTQLSTKLATYVIREWIILWHLLCTIVSICHRRNKKSPINIHRMAHMYRSVHRKGGKDLSERKERSLPPKKWSRLVLIVFPKPLRAKAVVAIKAITSFDLLIFFKENNQQSWKSWWVPGVVHVFQFENGRT